MESPMSERLTAQDWIDFALKTLAREGADTLKADVLARRLGVSRGSFYWHFASLGDFHARLIAHWREIATEAIIADLARHDSPAARLEALLRAALSHDARLEVRMRGWADTNAEAARALVEIDGRRTSYIERLLADAGVAPPLAAARAQLLYWAYLGNALGRGRLKGAPLERVVQELVRVGLGAVPASRRLHHPRRRSGEVARLQRLRAD
jgi:AcrR family transcriptional regulator